MVGDNYHIIDTSELFARVSFAYSADYNRPHLTHQAIIRNTMPEISHYDVLGIKRDALPEDIKGAWRKQCVALHPDKNPFVSTYIFHLLLT